MLCPPLICVCFTYTPLISSLCVLLFFLVCVHHTHTPLCLFIYLQVVCAFILPDLCSLYSHLLCLLLSRQCVLSSSLICVRHAHTPFLLLISSLCILLSFLMCSLDSCPALLLFLASVYFCPPSAKFTIITPLLHPHVEGVCASPLFSHTQSHLPLLSRLYVFSFSFINTDILPFWMKPYLRICNYGLLQAWKHHQESMPTSWKSKVNPKINEGFWLPSPM